MSKHGKILVAMSGGIDSTVAALLLHNDGYEVVGITMKTWDYAASGGSKKETGCCNLDSINDARQLAVDMGFAHYIVDIREEFGESVIENFVDEYIAGRTPNPCVLCNTHIKWSALIRRAKQMDCEFIATGHYARVRNEYGRYIISKAADDTKDQSYVLWGLAQENLSMTRFPLGQLKKSEVRTMCLNWGYADLARKSESYEICFIPDNDYRGFLKRRVPGLEANLKGGNFLNTEGEVIGEHDGYPFYTIGQRKGLGMAFGKQVFVTDIIAETNSVVLGDDDDLKRSGMIVGKVNLQKYESIIDGMPAVARVRYKDAGTACRLYNQGANIRVKFDEFVRAIAPGQSAVLYEDDDVIGGGIIHSSFML